LNLAKAVGQSSPHALLGLSSSIGESVAERSDAGRAHKHKVRLRERFLVLKGALDINIEDGDALAVLDIFDDLLASAVVVAMHSAVFNELVVLDHLLKLLLSHEMVVCSVDFTLSRGTRSVRDAEANFITMLRLQLVDECALARS